MLKFWLLSGIVSCIVLMVKNGFKVGLMQVPAYVLVLLLGPVGLYILSR